MPRPRAILQSDFPYNISGRVNNRSWFELPLEETWNIFCEELYMATMMHELRVHSFILMANHFHLIASTPLANVSTALKRFMEMTSRRLAERSSRTNRVWGARHFKSVLGSHSYFLNAYKYNYFNPVKAGIVERCEDYRFSTLRALLGGERLLFPVWKDTVLFPDPETTLQWLNIRPPQSHIEAIQAALRKAEFKHVKCPRSRKPILGDDEII